jgi:excisionase family DNA binding protein
MRPEARAGSAHGFNVPVSERAGDRLLLRVQDVCRLLDVGRSTVYELIARGELPVIRIGRLVRVPRPALEEWIVSNTAGAAAGHREAA